jgi:thiol:disulfide interchange protein
MQTLKLVILLGCLTVFSFGHKPAEKVEKTKWMTLKEASDSLKKEKRPILVDLYTNWCG